MAFLKSPVVLPVMNSGGKLSKFSGFLSLLASYLESFLFQTTVVTALIFLRSDISSVVVFCLRASFVNSSVIF